MSAVTISTPGYRVLSQADIIAEIGRLPHVAAILGGTASDWTIRDVADGSYDPALTPDEARPDVADVTWEPEANEDIDPAAGYEGGA